MKITAIEYYLPKKEVSNYEIAKFTNIDPENVYEKLGISRRYFVDDNETCSTMAVEACKKLLVKNDLALDEIGFLIAVTQNPDNILPGIAPLIQHNLNLRSNLAAFDLNLACSGYTYALSIANSFIKSGLFKKGLIVTAECYSKKMNMRDKKVCTLFGDAASASLVETTEDGSQFINFDFGTDGSGYNYLTIPAGGIKLPVSKKTGTDVEVEPGIFRSQNDIYMDGKEIFGFVMENIPKSIDNVLNSSNMQMKDINYFVFHQANNYVLKSLSRRLEIDVSKVIFDIENYGNTVSSTIPICLANMINQKKVNKGEILLLSGFGVGLSYCTAIYKY